MPTVQLVFIVFLLLGWWKCLREVHAAEFINVFFIKELSIFYPFSSVYSSFFWGHFFSCFSYLWSVKCCLKRIIMLDFVFTELCSTQCSDAWEPIIKMRQLTALISIKSILIDTEMFQSVQESREALSINLVLLVLFR